MPVEPADGTRDETVASEVPADKQAHPRRNAYLALLAALICGGIAILIYNQLNSCYPAATATVSTGDLSTQPELTVTNSPVQWAVQGGYIRQLTVQGPAQGQADVELPVSESLCAAIGRALDLTCRNGQSLAMGAPATFSWSIPVEVATPAGPAGSTALDLQTVAAPGGGYGANVTAETRSTPAVCFTLADPARLTVTSGGRTFGPEIVPSQLATCGQGAIVTAIVGSKGIGQPPGFEFRQVSSLTVSATGPAATLDGVTGQLELDPGGTSGLVASDAVAMRAHESAPLVTTLSIGPGPGASSLSTTSPGTTSVLTGAGQLVPSYWARHTAILVPLLGGFVTTFVVGPLGAWLKFQSEALLSWPWPFRRPRRPESQPEATDAPS
jgi:hypothetical protein